MTALKKLLLAAPFIFFLGAGPIAAEDGVDSILGPMQTAIQHGGGCRKDSPSGQCCHAGSKPYHCH